MSSPALSISTGRFVGIDALRGVAAVAVCLFHWEHIAFHTANTAQFFRFGLLGVELFFSISGFVILMVAERTRSVPAFVWARVVRLYPAYLASVGLTAIYVLWVQKYDLRVVSVNLTMLQSFVGVPNITNPYWTLAFEITFYGLFAAVLGARMLHRIEAISVMWLVIALLYRLLVAGAMVYDPSRPLIQLGYIVVAPQFAPFFVIGMMVYEFRRRQLGRVGWAAIAMALGSTLLGRGDFAAVSGPVYASFTCIMTVGLWSASRITMPGHGTVVLAWLGTLSYPLYLTHCTVANLCVTMAARLHVGAPIAVAISIPLCLVLAAALHYRVERPLAAAFGNMRLRSRAVLPDQPALDAPGL